MYRPVIVLCMLFLLQPCVQGMSLLGKRRCLCMGNGADHVDLKQIKKFEFFPPSSKCEKMEVIAKFKHVKKGLCLNPHSELVKSVVALSKKKSGDEK